MLPEPLAKGKRFGLHGKFFILTIVVTVVTMC